MLLLQHLALTFSALSFVRERLLGTFELFRVSPLRPLEALAGKYISYLIFGSIVAASLTGLALYVLGVPMLGDWATCVAIVAALLFASLGFGFVISLLSQSDSQAVQWSMLALLATVFFSGFFLRLELLWTPVRAISWILPATYGITLLQDALLRGTLTLPSLLPILVGIGVILFLLAPSLRRRQMARA